MCRLQTTTRHEVSASGRCIMTSCCNFIPATCAPGASAVFGRLSRIQNVERSHTVRMPWVRSALSRCCYKSGLRETSLISFKRSGDTFVVVGRLQKIKILHRGYAGAGIVAIGGAKCRFDRTTSLYFATPPARTFCFIFGSVVPLSGILDQMPITEVSFCHSKGDVAYVYD